VIFIDTNVVSEIMRPEPDAAVVRWLKQHETELALSTVVTAEVSFGIERIRPAERSHRLERTLKELRTRLRSRIFDFDEMSALTYGDYCGRSTRSGEPLAIADGMIAAIAIRHKAKLATRNTKHFSSSGLDLINPWTN
jgi:predicted nucleic acid-binding protein